MADFVLTPSGKQKIELELEQLKTVEMPALSERIRQARDLGDLSENFDYQDSKIQNQEQCGHNQYLNPFYWRTRKLS